jgi:hypothetical protein
MSSLLGQFFSRIKGSQEDIASKGLVYILQSSNAAKNALNKLIHNNVSIFHKNISYITQSVGDNNERPDISGIDNNGNEVIIIEAKFWSSLTSNQPAEYLKRLKEDSVLIFLCPKLRETSLFNEIESRIKSENINYQRLDNKLQFDRNNYIIIMNWNMVLNIIKESLINNNERTSISDIDQIIGFCEIIDNNTFLPIQDNDLSPSFAKRIYSYYDLLDKMVDKLKMLIDISTSGLKATPQRFGYTRYLRIGNNCVSLELNTLFWAEYTDTPFWISIKDHEWQQPNELKNKLINTSKKLNINIFNNNGNLYFPLIPNRRTNKGRVGAVNKLLP